MIANIISFIRIIIAFIVIILFQIHYIYTNFIAIVLIIIIIFMDALDGYLARKFKEASNIGAMIDVMSDRIIENIFWIYFSIQRLISFWIPAIIISRSFIVDTFRSILLVRGKTPSNKKKYKNLL